MCARAPSAGIVRVGALPLCVFAHLDVCPRALCGDRACRSAPAVRFCAFRCAPARPLRGSCVSERSHCAFLRISMCARAPSAGIVRVGALPLCGFAHCTTCFAHPLRGSCMSERSAVRFCAFCNLLRTPSAGIARVGALPLCVFAYFQAWSCTLCGDRACRSLPHLFLSSWRMPGAASTFCSTNVVRRGRPELP